MDTIALMKSGYLNTVATLGTALTAQQAKYLSNNFKEVVICYDGDNAGREARKRAISVLREHNVKISVIDMGAFKDPDEFISKNGVDRFNVILNSRKADMEYIMSDLSKSFDLSNNRDVVAYVDDVLDYLKLIKSSVEQDVYVNMLSGITKVSINALYAQLGISKAKTASGAQTQAKDPLILQLKKPKNNNALTNAREFLLSLIIFNKNVYNKHKDSITDELFDDDIHKKLLSYIKECYETDGAMNAYKITAHFRDDDESNACARILALDNRPDNAEKAYDDYMKIISREMQKNMAKDLMGTAGDLEKLNDLLKRKR